jgi:diaminohydroxyphosphoribosylaminopyrimidine deaminase/5-amino-6-(5-phosphoribosylamino)uracil reductase
MSNSNDPRWMAKALEQAAHAIGLSDPNPRVGCVLVGAQGEVLGVGHTQQAGGPHAEVIALRACEASGGSAQGATAYVTLEPCAHHGRTPPCADALVAAGVRRVVVAVLDPNPLVDGGGVQRLRAAGVEVNVLPADDPLALRARELNIGFMSRMTRGRPWVRLKVAGSLDGRTALDNGASQWITGEAARADGRVWRSRATAVMTGIGTVLDDDPRLDVRGIDVASQPWRVVLDSQWRLPLSAQVLAPTAPVHVFGLPPTDPAATARKAALVAHGVHAVDVPALSGKTSPLPGQTRLDLAPIFNMLAQNGVNELHVEAGANLNASLIEGGWVDELLVYLAPKLIGPGRGLAALSPLVHLSDARSFVFHDVSRVGEDLRVLLRPTGPVGL